MPSGSNLDASATSVAFEPCLDPFRHTDVEEGEDEGLDERYTRLAQDIFGETPEKMEELIQELKRELAEKGFVVPDKRAFYVKMLRAGRIEHR